MNEQEIKNTILRCKQELKVARKIKDKTKERELLQDIKRLWAKLRRYEDIKERQFDF